MGIQRDFGAKVAPRDQLSKILGTRNNPPEPHSASTVWGTRLGSVAHNNCKNEKKSPCQRPRACQISRYPVLPNFESSYPLNFRSSEFSEFIQFIELTARTRGQPKGPASQNGPFGESLPNRRGPICPPEPPQGEHPSTF